MRIVENARNEFVKHARNIPKDLPEADKLIDYLRPELQKIFAETKDPAQAYLKIGEAFDRIVDRFKISQDRKAA